MSLDLFKIGHFSLHSGIESFFKIDCDALNAHERKALVRVAMPLLPKFGRAVGVPTGGLAFAKEMDFHATGQDDPILIVDDVLTTGGSMNEFRAALQSDSKFGTLYPQYIGLVIFARGPCPDWIQPIFSLNAQAAQEKTRDDSNNRSNDRWRDRRTSVEDTRRDRAA